ncbi:SIR2 family protein [Sphingorhabdus sp. SMR4y]|uniref:SIR2 family protein n=1 Tax=Sphingorhabdus sp. SMR4y TaxID=2584094 RepID=UPI000B61B55A|nr:SIR2 family protein [Sphingorhabdus sp. SMR4y]ASK89760.1 SIR2-like domain protein [Sphingorhabdus sp. SMR4y]
MNRPVILLGAGASMDAGLPDALGLTEVVYDELHKPEYGSQRILFGYVISKLQARQVLSGGSPFNKVNIEDAYDAILRLLSRNSDPLSEFVYSWDPILDHIKPKFNEKKFMKGIIEAIQDQSRNRSHGLVHVNQHRLHEAAKSISEAVNSDKNIDDSSQTAAMYIDILVKILSNPPHSIKYLDKLVSWSDRRNAIVGTLNYDMLVENSCVSNNCTWDYGLDEWSSRQFVGFKKQSINLIKLHGSINWSGTLDDIIVHDTPPEISKWHRSNASMIFGGQDGKLRVDGPFLNLRYEFEKSLNKSNRLIIIGYSFSDAHINSILRRWVASRNKAKMIIVNPGAVDFGLDVFQQSYTNKENERLKTVDITHIKRTAAHGIDKALEVSDSRFNPNYEHKNGFLPHILVTRIE